MKHNYFTKVSIFFDITHSTLMCLSHFGKVFTIDITEIRLLNSSCHKIYDPASVVSLAEK